MEILATVIKLKYQTTVLGLAIIGVLAVAGATLILSQQGGAAQQLQEARK